MMERLDAEGIKYEYERESYQIVLDQPGFCRSCGKKDIGRVSRYTPDFFFADFIVEAKGKFTARDRKRVLALIEVLEKIPSKGKEWTNFGMLFQRDNKLSKSSETRYSEWCEKRGIPWAVGWFKQEWLR